MSWHPRSGGNFSKPGAERKASDFTTEVLEKLLTDDVKLDERADGEGADHLAGITEAELATIMDRDALFAEPCLLPSEGANYDIIVQAQDGGILGEMS